MDIFLKNVNFLKKSKLSKKMDIFFKNVNFLKKMQFTKFLFLISISLENFDTLLTKKKFTAGQFL